MRRRLLSVLLVMALFLCDCAQSASGQPVAAADAMPLDGVASEVATEINRWAHWTCGGSFHGVSHRTSYLASKPAHGTK